MKKNHKNLPGVCPEDAVVWLCVKLDKESETTSIEPVFVVSEDEFFVKVYGAGSMRDRIYRRRKVLKDSVYKDVDVHIVKDMIEAVTLCTDFHRMNIKKHQFVIDTLHRKIDKNLEELTKKYKINR